MKNRYPLWLVFLLLPGLLKAQRSVLEGLIQAEGLGVPGATVLLPALERGTAASEQGAFRLQDLPAGQHLLRVSAVGYRSLDTALSLVQDSSLSLNLVLEPDWLELEQVVVTGTRSELPRYQSPVLVHALSKRSFEATQSLTLAEGLSFAPGLRVENNCQNCGFTQVRMNGLEGAYTQVLVNSRPIFSALAGVYGLEMLPAVMIDRVEVVRGGGSALYGSNAIAGTINILTKDPEQNAFDIRVQQALTNAEASDRTLSLGGAVLSREADKGSAFFANLRDREAWDANGDELTEMTRLRNHTLGFNAFLNPSERSKIRWGAYSIREDRRGGSELDRPPHQSRIAESLHHQVFGSTASYEHYLPGYRHKFSVYGAAQRVQRDSYYGGGGRIIAPGDSLTESDLLALNAYGDSRDIAGSAGLQYHWEPGQGTQLSAGLEYQANRVRDDMPGYGRSIDQRVSIASAYGQWQQEIAGRLQVVAGARLDRVAIRGTYDLNAESLRNEELLQVLVPRLSTLYSLNRDWKARLSYAQGYRAPQAFDEDLHIETVGGAARFIRLSPDLEMERSHSLSGSMSYNRFFPGVQLSLLAEGFYTRLNNAFLLSDPEELPSGVAVITKRNGSGAEVYGWNGEANLALGSRLVAQSGMTVQRARYREEELLWSPQEPEDNRAPTATRTLLRTPNAYGYLSLSYQTAGRWSFSTSGVFTGRMAVPHVIDPETEYTAIKTTPVFAENNWKLNYAMPVQQSMRIQLSAGVYNLFNSYQRDLDTGVERDAGYVFGPIRPRTPYLSVQFAWE